MKQSTRRIKLSRKIKTVDDLLTRSDVNDTLNRVIISKRDIENIIIIYSSPDGTITLESNGINTNEELGMLLQAQDMILHPGNKDEDD